MELFANRPPIKVDKPTPHEVVLRLFILKLNFNYKDGWLYYRCKDEGLLEQYDDFLSNGIFDQLKGDEKAFIEPELTIELVPKTCWFSNVRSNVTKEQWDKLRKATYAKAEYQCQICGGRGPKWPVECHEIWDYADKSLIQTLTGLIALCPSCHKVKHMGFAQISGKEIEMTCHLAIINGWTYKAACQYVGERFDLWRKRSKYDWLLDISWLGNFDIQVDTKDRLDLAYQDCDEIERQHYLTHRKQAIDLFVEGVDYERAGEYLSAEQAYLKASGYGHIDATVNLAIFHLKKKISDTDDQRGIAFLKKAARLGDQRAKNTVVLSEEELLKLFNNEDKKEEDEDKREKEVPKKRQGWLNKLLFSFFR